MDAAKWKNIKDYFSAVLDLPEERRAEFLARENDEEIRSEVEKLIAAHNRAENFISQPILIEQGVVADESNDPFLGKQIENYLILERIGTGGMGAVYLAERQNSDYKQKVALKIIKRGMDSEAILRRFAIERKILSTLKHPNIAQLLDGGISGEGVSFFVMEYVNGKPLNRFCRENRLSLEKRLEIFREICAAVEYAHKNLIVHRDLKPTNILVTSEGVPKLLDFGIAKLLSNDEFGTTVPATQGKMFTPEYASPEQILGKNVTTATDVYSLGVILYELLSGHRPFETKGKSYNEIVLSVCETEPVPPSHFVGRPSFTTNQTSQNKEQKTKSEPQKTNSESEISNPKFLRGDLDNIILKAIRREPERRYQSVQEFSYDIQRYLNGLPVKATADSRLYRFSKFVQRHRAGVFAAVLISLFLLTATVFSSWQFMVARRERMRAEERFGQIRELANLVIFDYDERIKSLSGTTVVREKIVRDTLEYLDRLAANSEDSPDLQRELALAYQKIGSIQGDSDYLSNLGKTKDALDSFRKAVLIQEKVTNSPSATAKDRQILARFNFDVALLLGILGDWEQQRQINLENLPVLEKAAALAPDDWETQADLARGFRSVGNMASHGNGTYPEAIENFRQALAIYETLAPTQPQKFSRLKAITEKNLGSALQLNGNLDEAIVFFQRAFEYDSTTVKNEPNNLAAKIDLSFSYRALGGVFEEKNESTNAMQNFQKALQIRLEILSADPNDDFTRSAVARSYNHIGEINFRMKNFAEAETNFRKSLEIFDSQTQADPTNTNKKNYLGQVLGNLGDVYFETAKNGGEKLKRLKQAETFYKQSLEIFSTLENSLSVNDKNRADEISRHLNQTAAEIKKLSGN